ncbi:MAG TPA: hypothetical protein VMG81_00700 [Thermoplasmata archaeon]|nr:hypothetical protein [Thermoplasmata archaeon]
MVSYPSNDIQEEIADASEGETITLDENSVFHQSVAVPSGVEIDLNGYSLAPYRGPDGAPPVLVYGQMVTGPAAWFLDVDGNPIGYPGAPRPAGVQHNLLWCKSSASGIRIYGGKLDFNVLLPTDTWGAAFFMPSGSIGGHQLTDLTYTNRYGGIGLYPDPPHLDAPNMLIQNVKGGANAIPAQPTLHGGVPGLVIGGAPNISLPGCAIESVSGAGFLELDGILAGLIVTGLTCTHILIGNSVPPGSWGGSVWSKVKASWPTTAGPVLNFNGGPYSDWTIKNSTFDGKVVQDPAGNFSTACTWGPGNTPASLGSSTPPSGGGGTGALLAGIGVLGAVSVGLYAIHRAGTRPPRPAPRPYVRAVA